MIITNRKSNILNKHKKYEERYKNIEKELYWGLGIENELYLEFDNQIEITKDFFIKNHTKERYSVNYYLNYNKMQDKMFREYYNKNKEIIKRIPLIMNSHSFIYTDIRNQPKRLYTKNNEENPKFSGETLIENILKESEELRESYNREWLFDGDTIEFTTLNFYNSKLNDIINELEDYKKKFIKNLQIYQKKTKLYEKYGLIKLMTENHAFTIHLTNINNIAIFNNGTLHYNITLPTILENHKIQDEKKFMNDHKKAIKIIQWFEPLLIAIYNTKDPFTIIKNKINQSISEVSQRCAISRYIGIGTYDSDKMEKGKLLTKKTDIFKNNWWYKRYHESSVYNKLEEVGLDINFNKHYNHGIELRFFDHMSDNNLIQESYEFIIYLMDTILEIEEDNIINPIYDDDWNNIMLNIMKFGKKYIMSQHELNIYIKILKINNRKIFNDIYNVENVYYVIYNYLMHKYNKISKQYKKYKITPIGKFSSLVFYTRIITNENYNNILKSTNIIDNITCFNIKWSCYK